MRFRERYVNLKSVLPMPAGVASRCTIATFAMAVAFCPGWAADLDSVSWGPAAGDLRLGLGVESKSVSLRIAFQNVGRTEMDVLLGGKTGKGPMYLMSYSAIDAAGAEFPVVYFGGVSSVGGYVEPLLVRVAPSEIYELALPLDKFSSFVNGDNLTLESLLRKGYALRAGLSVKAASAKWSSSAAAWRGPADFWTGSVRSADFRWTPSDQPPKR